MEQIVVGVDGSESSRTALEWAVDEASHRGATVVAVHAWEPILTAGLRSAAVYSDEAIQEAGGAVLDEAIAAVDPPEGVTIERRCVRGNATAALLEVAGGADLLVVGTRGLGGFGRLLLGSVSSQVVHHAPCPVVVVPITDH